jgi:hypothetical protein
MVYLFIDLLSSIYTGHFIIFPRQRRQITKYGTCSRWFCGPTLTTLFSPLIRWLLCLFNPLTSCRGNSQRSGHPLRKVLLTVPRGSMTVVKMGIASISTDHFVAFVMFPCQKMDWTTGGVTVLLDDANNTRAARCVWFTRWWCQYVHSIHRQPIISDLILHSQFGMK